MGQSGCYGYSSKDARVDLDLGNRMIQMINISSETLEDVLKTHKYKQKSKTQDGRSSGEDTRRIGTPDLSCAHCMLWRSIGHHQGIRNLTGRRDH